MELRLPSFWGKRFHLLSPSLWFHNHLSPPTACLTSLVTSAPSTWWPPKTGTFTFSPPTSCAPGRVPSQVTQYLSWTGFPVPQVRQITFSLPTGNQKQDEQWQGGGPGSVTASSQEYCIGLGLLQQCQASEHSFKGDKTASKQTNPRQHSFTLRKTIWNFRMVMFPSPMWESWQPTGFLFMAYTIRRKTWGQQKLVCGLTSLLGPAALCYLWI